MSLAEYFATAAAFERPIFERVRAQLDHLDPLRVEAVTIGILFKRVRTFAELRPMRERVRLGMLFSAPLESPRFVRTERLGGSRMAFFVDLRHPDDVDDEVRDWLTDAYFSSPISR